MRKKRKNKAVSKRKYLLHEDALITEWLNKEEDKAWDYLKSVTLDNLIEGISPDNVYPEIPINSPIGKEI